MRRVLVVPLFALGVLAGCSSSEPTVSPPGQVIGHVELADELPATGCFVVVQGHPTAAHCDADGNFQINGLPAGKWNLRIFANREDKTPRRKVLAGSNSGLVTHAGVVKLGKPGAVGGHLAGTPDPGAYLVVEDVGMAVAPSENGGYLLSGVTGGSHDVLLVGKTGVLRKPGVEVLPGKVTAPVDFELGSATPPAEVTVFGFVSGPDAKALEGVTVDLLDAVEGSSRAQVTPLANGAFSAKVKAGVYLVRANPTEKLIASSAYLVVGTSDVDVGTLYLPAVGGDLDADGLLDAVDPDADGDGTVNDSDVFAFDPLEVADKDGDGIGDRSDLKSKGGAGLDIVSVTPDQDADGDFDFEDNCPKKPNPDQLDDDADAVGNECDNCVQVVNPDQKDLLGNGVGDACRVCAPITCTEFNKDCGLIPDGCGGVLDCGACMAPKTCGGNGNPNVCGQGGTCTPQTCQSLGKNCGLIPTGCGSVEDCGACTAPDWCGGGGNQNVCGSQPACVPVTCTALNKNCGLIPDGCGGVLDCGICTSPQLCGGAGNANVCGQGPGCQPSITCAQFNKNCGLIPDGCNGVINCGSCTSPQTCGGAGDENVCGTSCYPVTCAILGKTCGTLADGCGGTLNCGTCGTGTACVNDQCVAVCTPTTCSAQGKNCGVINDGCGSALNCGSCAVSGETCGGGGVTNVCGAGCAPASCASLNKNCGQVADGCGGTLTCGSCTYPQICGAQGVSNVCAQCPGYTTCALAGKDCGFIADGCGGTHFCGGCTGPATCGGTGSPNVCGIGTHVLAVTSGNNQKAMINQAVPAAAVVQVTASSNGAAVPSLPMTYTAPLGGSTNPTPTGVTDANGNATFTPLLPRKPGTNLAYTAIAQNGGSKTVMMEAEAPPAGTMIPIANGTGFTGVTTAFPAYAVNARLRPTIGGLAVASDKTIYFTDTDNNLVLKVTPEGLLEKVAGGGTAAGPGYGDYGLAKSANLYGPSGVALDEVNQKLYVSDTRHGRVRVIDVSSQSGVILPYAGTGASMAAPAPWGDGGPAASAYLPEPGPLTFGPDGALYVTDTNQKAIRRIDPVSTVITFFFHSTNSNPSITISNTDHLLSFCGSAGIDQSWSCHLAFDALGNAFISGRFQGKAAGNAWQIVRRAPDGRTTTVVGGGAAAPATNNILATAVGFSPPFNSPVSGLALDAAGNLYFAESIYNRIRRVDGVTGIITTIAGTGTAGSSGNFGPASAAEVSSPVTLAFEGKNLVVGDCDGASVRMIWGAGSQTATSLVLSKAAGDNPSGLLVGQPFSLSAKVEAGSSAAGGVPVTFTSSTPGVSLPQKVITTIGTGHATQTVRPGLSATPFTWTATISDYLRGSAGETSVTFTATPALPGSGVVFAPVNDNGGLKGKVPGPGSAPAFLLTQPTGIAVVKVGWSGATTFPAGTMFVADRVHHHIYMVTPDGELSVFAGTGGTGYGGDTGPAKNAVIDEPRSLLLDETNRKLYVASRTTSIGNIRVIDLNSTTYTIDLYAGFPTTNTTGADGVPATSISLYYPNGLVQHPVDGAIWFSESSSQGRIRRIDPSTRIIHTIVQGGSANPAGIVFDTCSDALAGCGLAFVGTDLYIAGRFHEPATFNNAKNRIVKRTAAGALSFVAGHVTAAQGVDGSVAATTGLATLGGMVSDASGNLTFIEAGACRVRRFNPATPGATLQTIIGDGTTGAGTCGLSASYVSGSGLMRDGYGLAFTPADDLLVTDMSNGMVRQRMK